tara:strand:+ start:24 stop:269 length:246 start_codon:yes stop_codon:yes gene_type:complete
MNVEAKRDELTKWINNLDEKMLNKVDELKKSSLNEFVIYTADGKGLTKKQYKAHLNKISESVDAGEKTYTSEEVRNYVLNR